MALIPIGPDPPEIDNSLPRPPGLPPFPGNALPWPQPPYDDIEPIDIFALAFLRIFYPGFFDPRGDYYVDPIQVIVSLALAREFRPECLTEKLQALAQAHYAAYLLQEYLQNEASGGIGGGGGATNSGIILSEKEGDIAVTYADPRQTQTGSGVQDDKPPSTAWGKWNKLAQLCRYGAITTRAGRPLY